jgi:hypothetical protein
MRRERVLITTANRQGLPTISMVDPNRRDRQ